MNCTQCKSSFEINLQDRQFLDNLKIPYPKKCPTCRKKLRLAHWPYGILQKRKCDFSGETIVSTYPPGARFPVYKKEHWFSDKWEPPQQEIDWNRSFFDQLYELQCKTPHFHQLGKQNTNCDYADDVWESKNAYMSRSMAGVEDVYYVYRILYSKNCVDITYAYELEQCYECTYCFKCYNLKFALNCRECSDSSFLYDCHGCRNCFMCWNLRNKEYCILNKEYSKEEYYEKIKELKLNSRKFLHELRIQFNKHIRDDAFHKENLNLNNQNCTGNYNLNCKNCDDAYFLEYGEDCRHVMRAPYIKNTMDVCGLLRAELCYEICQSTDLHNVQFASFSVDCNDSQYIDQCFNGNNLFGCVGLKRKKYCILNKQYSKEEYKELRDRIIKKMKKDEEYGGFFPYKFAYNGYNLSLGMMYYPESLDDAMANGSYLEKEPKSSHDGIDANTLPDDSSQISDDLIGKPIVCKETKKTFNLIKQELDFYRSHNLPLPDLYPEKRNELRFIQLAPLQSIKIKCFKCSKDIVTYFPYDWEYEKILCEECYLETVY